MLCCINTATLHLLVEKIKAMARNLNEKIYVAGHQGMVGSAIHRALIEKGYENIITKTRNQLDLTDQASVKNFFEQETPTQVYLAAAKVGGIYANDVYPAEFIYQNLMIQSNVIHQAFRSGVKRLIFLGSSCIYPKLASQPMSEGSLLTGKLESTNEPYAVAKIAGIKMCESYNRQYGQSHGVDFRSVMPTNLYGPGDNYHPQNSHVIPALIRKFHEAKISSNDEVVIWGTGAPMREFLYVGDMAQAAIFIMEVGKLDYDSVTLPMQSHINVGFGVDISIHELSSLIAKIIGYKGRILFDHSMPDGAPRKLMDSSALSKLGWSPRYSLEDGLALTYDGLVSSEFQAF